MLGKTVLFCSFFASIFLFFQGLTVAPNYEEQQVTRFVLAESGCESPLTVRAVAYIIISATKLAGIQPSRAIDLDRGFYLSSWRAAALQRANNNTLIYYSDFSELIRQKCAPETLNEVRKAFAIQEPTTIYHFDNCKGKASWKDNMIAAKMNEADSTCIYARSQSEVDTLKSKVN